MIEPARRQAWLAVAALTALGLGLRVAAARGALWLDEAWSAQFAMAAKTAVGVFFTIHHDNNHLLNTLWLQLVGPDAPPMLQRALAIVCGTAMVPAAALFAGQRSRLAGVVAAFVFAISPIMVTYGAEARGYAPMMLATLVALVVTDRWLEAPTGRASLWLSLCALLGTLAQFLMVASLAAIAGWLFFELRRTKGPNPALRQTTALMIGPALIAGLVLGVVAVAAWGSATGFEVGSYSAFRFADWHRALATASGWTIGAGALGAAPLLFVAVLVIGAVLWRRRDSRAPLYAMAVLAYPLAFVVLRIGNAGEPRYYLLAMLVLLLLLADLGAASLRSGGIGRIAAVVLLALFTAGSLHLDGVIAANRRGDPALAIAAMKQRAPDGTTLAVANDRMVPVLAFAARAGHYRLRVVEGHCRQAPFLFADGDADSANMGRLRYCGQTYRQVARAQVHGLSGTWWWLFERT
ncbi:MAG: hypothetical protein ACTHMG_01485 [Sphingomonas sp.]